MDLEGYTNLIEIDWDCLQIDFITAHSDIVMPWELPEDIQFHNVDYQYGYSSMEVLWI